MRVLPRAAASLDTLPTVPGTMMPLAETAGLVFTVDLAAREDQWRARLAVEAVQGELRHGLSLLASQLCRERSPAARGRLFSPALPP